MTNKLAPVAGGAVFVGSHLCDSLFDDGYDVLCIDNFGSGRPRNVEHLLDHPRSTLREEDIRQPPALPPVDEIYHLDPRAPRKDFTDFPVRIDLTNTEGMQNILDHTVACDVKMLFASTSEVTATRRSTLHPRATPATSTYAARGAVTMSRSASAGR